MEVAIDADTKYSNMMTMAAGCTTMVLDVHVNNSQGLTNRW